MSVFRKVSLERLSSPEQLDLLMQITNPKSWLGLLGVVSLMIVVIIWAVIGRIPIEITGSAILLPPGGINQVIALHNGQVSDLQVASGDVIESGQVIGTVNLIGQESAQPIISPFAGRAVEVKTVVGQLIEPGTPVISIANANSGSQLEAIMYVSRVDAQQLAPGMAVKLVPESVQVQEFGFLLGEVASIGEFPVSKQGVANTIGSDELATLLVMDDAPIEVRITLLEDASTASGWQWTSSSGPNFNLRSGTIGVSSIIVDEQRPFNLIFSNK